MIVGNMTRPVNSLSEGSLPHCFCCYASSLVWSNAVWNTMKVDKARCRSMAGSLGRSTEGKAGKYESRVSVYLERPKCYRFHDGSHPMESNHLLCGLAAQLPWGWEWRSPARVSNLQVISSFVFISFWTTMRNTSISTIHFQVRRAKSRDIYWLYF